MRIIKKNKIKYIKDTDKDMHQETAHKKTNNKKTIYKGLCLVMSLFMVLSAVMTGSYAWQAIVNKENLFSGTQVSKYSALLFKFERDSDGLPGEKPIANTVFYLYKIINRENSQEEEEEFDDERVRIGGRYRTGANGKIEVKNLTAGNYVFVETVPAPGFTYDKNSDGADIKEYYFTVNKDTENKTAVVKAYNRHIYKNLEISKTVVNKDGSELTDAQKELLFDFEVRLEDLPDGMISVIIDGAERQTPIVDSVMSIELKHGQTAVISLPVGTFYKVIEVPAENYIMSSSGNQGNITANGSYAAFVNTYGKLPAGTTTLSVKKITTGEGADLDKLFDFVVTIGDVKHEFSLKHGQTKEFDLDIGQVYDVSEKNYIDEFYEQTEVESGYGTATQEPITAVKTNNYIGEVMVEIPVKKIWDMNGSEVQKPGGIIVKLLNGGLVEESREITAEENWQYIFTAPRYGADGNEIVYTVEEEPVPGYECEINGYEIKNTYITPAEYSPVIEKIIGGDVPQSDEEFGFVLTAVAGDIEPPMPVKNTVVMNGAGSKSFEKISYDRAGIYRYTVTEINAGKDGYTYDGTVYTLTVAVEKAGNNFEIKSAVYMRPGDVEEYSKAAFTNIYSRSDPNNAAIKVEKRWVGDNPNQPESVIVQLLNGGTAHGGPVVLSRDNNWTHVWTGLDKNGVWTVDEPVVPERYTKSIKGSAADGFVIINTFEDVPVKDEKVIISGEKIWMHGNNPTGNYPASIVVFIKNGDYVAVQQTVTKATGWKWAFELPRYENGVEINYTVDEAKVYGYSKKIDGFNLVNTYMPPNGSDYIVPPNTNDAGNMTLWFVFMIISAFVLRFMLGRVRAPVGKI